MVWNGKDHVCEIIVSDRKLMINFSSCRGNRLPGTNKTKTKKKKRTDIQEVILANCSPAQLQMFHRKRGTRHRRLGGTVTAQNTVYVLL